MKSRTLGLLLALITASAFAQSGVDQEVLKLSKDKWQWMADNDVDKLKDQRHGSKSLETVILVLRQNKFKKGQIEQRILKLAIF